MDMQILECSNLTQRDLSEVRKKITPEAYKKSMRKTFVWFTVDLVFYLMMMYGVFVTHGIILKLIFGFLAGIAASSMFVWAHDAAHGALFKNKLIAEILGTLFMLPALNMYRLWVYGHNRIHHGFTSFSPLDWIWRPLTISEYRGLSKFRKLLYRVERSLYGCGLHYIYKVWWPKMVMFNPSDMGAKSIFAIKIDKIIVSIFAIVIAWLYFVYGVIAGLILPFIVFNYVISLVVYLHHTHPSIPFFDERAEWNHTIGALYCTTVIYSNWLIDSLLHHIMIHTPHHVDIRIPFYRLKTALVSIKENYGQYLHEYHMDMSTLKHIFKSCKLYDYHKHIWYDFSSAKMAVNV
jgi:acyl-lipid omega-6 desaturase (Delta-12 desaturase)